MTEMENLPLSQERQAEITPVELAKLILQILQRNDQMRPDELRWKVNYYPYSLQSIRGFEVIGHAQPEVLSFARKWSEAVAILKSRAFIAADPTQRDENFVIPTSFADPNSLDKPGAA